MSVEYDSDRLIRELKEFLGIPKEITVDRTYSSQSDRYIFRLRSPDKQYSIDYSLAGTSFRECNSMELQITLLKRILNTLWESYQNSAIENW